LQVNAVHRNEPPAQNYWPL